MSLIRDARGGKDNDPNFHTRFTGEGPYATLIRQRVDMAKERYGLNKPIPPLRTDLFVPPRVDDGADELVLRPSTRCHPGESRIHRSAGAAPVAAPSSRSPKSWR